MGPVDRYAIILCGWISIHIDLDGNTCRRGDLLPPVEMIYAKQFRYIAHVQSYGKASDVDGWGEICRYVRTTHRWWLQRQGILEHVLRRKLSESRVMNVCVRDATRNISRDETSDDTPQ